jgi:hypothetical protein
MSMQRLILRVPGTFSGPQVVAEPRLNDGSILLIEPGYPGSEISSLADAATIPNHAAASALVLYPGTSTSLATINNNLTGTTGIAELSDKGAVHVAVKKAGTVASQRWYLTIATDFEAAINAKVDAGTAKFYCSVWGRITRPNTYAVTNFVLAGLTQTNADASFWGASQSATTGNISSSPTTATEGRTTATLASGLGPFRVDVGHLKSAVTVNSMSSAVVRMGNFLAAHTNLAPSWIFYALYLEDLTASGRTYDEASAMDAEMYADAFGPGGRYYDDDWTDPLTI